MIYKFSLESPSSQSNSIISLNNWYTYANSVWTPASVLPSVGDDVTFISSVTDLTTVSDVTYNSLTVINSTITTNKLYSITVTANTIFINSINNTKLISANPINFYGNSINQGIVTGSAIFYDMSYNGSGGIYTTATFNSINKKGINGPSLMF